MSLSADLTLIHRTLGAYAGEHCRFRGSTLSCLASSESRGTILTSGGKELEIQLTLYLLKEDLIAAFRSQGYSQEPPVSGDSAVVTADTDAVTADDSTVMPRTGEKITYKEREYRIAQVRAESQDSTLRLELADFRR